MKHRKKIVKPKARRADAKAHRKKKQPTVGERIIEGLEQAVAWSRGEDVPAQVTLVRIPEIDVKEVRRQMGLSQTEFATKFGFPPATLRNWEQGRVRPDASTRVLLAVIAKHPESVEDVLSGRR
jgi:putative transcriptional regulator